MEAGNHGNRKEVEELGMEAFDHRYGEEVTPENKVLVCVCLVELYESY